MQIVQMQPNQKWKIGQNVNDLFLYILIFIISICIYIKGLKHKYTSPVVASVTMNKSVKKILFYSFYIIFSYIFFICICIEGLKHKHKSPIVLF